ncbi:MAG: transposase [Deltaproteobacteria bacterium]|nr:transposase [Deltaproteobacteria bacterium]MBF0526560.1 transposase [Deltaproteobacteria bacterium]
MITVKSYKYRIYPTKSQISALENQFSMCRHLYNWSLQERIEAYQSEKKSLPYEDQANKLPALKRERPWFKNVYSQVLQDVLKRLDKGFTAFFRRVKAGETPGFPKFKKRGQWNSITYPQHAHRPAGKVVNIPKVGDVKLIYHREIPQQAKIKTLTVTKEADKWFACFSVELPFNVEPKQDLLPSIGIDLGLIDFLYASDGSHVPAPRYYRKLQKGLARLQRRFAKAEKRSNKWYRLLAAIQKVYYRLRCLKHDFLHKTVNSLLAKADAVFHEDLNIRGMIWRPKAKQGEDGKYFPNGAGAKSGLNKSIADAAWGQFLTILGYKAAEQNKVALAVPPHYTSQTCPECGEVVKKSLSVRTHRCPCGFVANRDFAASLNILRVGLDTLAGKPA